MGELSAATQWTEEPVDRSNAALQDVPRCWYPNAGWIWLQGDAAVEGRLVGGCIEVLEMAKGTAVWPADEEWDGAVLHLEMFEDAGAATGLPHQGSTRSADRSL